MVNNQTGKFGSVMESLRGGIIRGLYSPGHRLPPMTDICNELGTGLSTVQRVLSQLADDGYVESGAKRNGTFVAEHPPHLSNYGLVSMSAMQWSKLMVAIHKATGIVSDDKTVRFNEYFISVEANMQREFKRLCDDVCNYRVGGLILPHGVEDAIANTPIIKQPGIPRVWPKPMPDSDIPSVYFDTIDSFIRLATDYLAGRNRRRIAHISLVAEHSYRRPIEEVLRETGIELRPYWYQTVSVGTMHETVPNMVNLLMQLEEDRRPDALIIHDDNLIEHVTAGLLAAGVKVPDELEIVAHYNYPSVAPCTLPMTRLGFDCRMFLRKCIEILDMQREGLPVPKATAIPAIFEEELMRAV